MVAAYVANLEAAGAGKCWLMAVLAALNKLFNWLVAGNIRLEANVASAVRGHHRPKHHEKVQVHPASIT